MPEDIFPFDDPSWPYYAQTILELFADRIVTLDLRQELSPHLRADLLSAIGSTFAVITACNPRGHAMSEEANRRRTLDLRVSITERGLTWLPADGVSPDRRHREEGVAVVMAEEAAQRLARDYEQTAFFWFDGSDMWLKGARAIHAAVRLPSPYPRVP
jgi:hypothetical protein